MDRGAWGGYRPWGRRVEHDLVTQRTRGNPSLPVYSSHLTPYPVTESLFSTYVQ